jgi:hypothetical protein
MYAAMIIDPMPRRARHDGWTLDRQHRFVAALAEYGNLLAVAARVGMTRQSLYRLQRQGGAMPFVRHGLRRAPNIVAALQSPQWRNERGASSP